MPEVIRALLAVEEFYDEFGLHSLSSEPLNKWHTLSAKIVVGQVVGDSQ
jgi:hypothetical protein